ncbi:MAG: hypothetical protein PHW74_00290 [Desulfobacca sp.]|nr:hypothetical protein [Desulfobacca sp.]
MDSLDSGNTKLITLFPTEKVLSSEKIRETRPSGEEDRETSSSPKKLQKHPPKTKKAAENGKTENNDHIIDILV